MHYLVSQQFVNLLFTKSCCVVKTILFQHSISGITKLYLSLNTWQNFAVALIYCAKVEAYPVALCYKNMTVIGTTRSALCYTNMTVIGTTRRITSACVCMFFFIITQLRNSVTFDVMYRCIKSHFIYFVEHKDNLLICCIDFVADISKHCR